MAAVLKMMAAATVAEILQGGVLWEEEGGDSEGGSVGFTGDLMCEHATGTSAAL